MRTVLFFLVLSLTGCSIFHSETRDKQAQELAAEYSKINFEKKIKTARENRETLVNTQIETREIISKGKASSAIRTIVFSNSKTDTVDNMLSSLSIAVKEPVGFGKIAAGSISSRKKQRIERFSAYEKLRKSEGNLTVVTESLVRINYTLEMLGYSAPSCQDFSIKSIVYKKLDSELKSGKLENSAAAKIALSELVKMCSALLEEEEAIVKIVDSLPEIKKTNDSIINERNKIKELKQDAGKIINDFELNAKKLAEAKKQSASEKQLQKLKSISEQSLTVIKSSSNAYVMKYVSEEKLKSIEDFLLALKTYDPEKGAVPATPREIVALTSIISIDSEVDKANGIADIEWGPLVMLANVNSAQAEAATREIKTRELKISFLEEKRKLQLHQIKQFSMVDESLIGMDDRLLELKLAVILGLEPLSKENYQPSIDEKVSVHQALAYYIDAGTRLKKDIDVVQVKINALEGEIRLVYAETNLKQWTALTDVNVASLEAAGKVGLTSAQINAFMNNVFLFWIGKGVN